ncbi:MAG: spore coat protein [Clostridiales bacterium]|nr:spore coat protein [Clostridiales bacterium]
MSKNQLSEKDMLLDSIMTERYVSSVYDTGVMESVNEEVTKTLQHIQQEEQNHTKLFMEVMHNKGWYDVKASHINQAAKDQINKQMAFQLENRINQIGENNQQNNQ